MFQQIQQFLQPVVAYVVPILATAIAAALVKEAKKIGPALIDLLTEKLAKAKIDTASADYKTKYNLAVAAWDATDEHFRISAGVEKTLDSAWAWFAQELKARAPGITDDEIALFRQAIAGMVNQGRGVITTALEPKNTAAAPTEAVMGTPAAGAAEAVIPADTTTGQ